MVEQVLSGKLRKYAATWEHIFNDQNITTKENIARCYSACNSSKGTKKLSDWINSEYCKKNQINGSTVTSIIKNVLQKRGCKVEQRC